MAEKVQISLVVWYGGESAQISSNLVAEKNILYLSAFEYVILSIVYATYIAYLTAKSNKCG